MSKPTHHVDINGMACCGLEELHGIRGSDPEAFFAEYRNTKGDWIPEFHSHVVFTDIDTPYKRGDAPYKYGEMFKSYIRAQGLGTVQETTGEVNPNTGSKVKAYLWTPIPALRRAYSEPEDDDY